MTGGDAIERQQFSIDESWSEEDEDKKQNFYNKALKEREYDLNSAREQLQMLRDTENDSAAVVGSLVALAYQLNEAAAFTARMQEEEVPESVKILREEFDEALTLESGKELSPDKVQRWSEEVSSLGRPPYYLRKLMDENGTKIRNLIGLAYAGTEVMTEGSSEEEKRQMK